MMDKPTIFGDMMAAGTRPHPRGTRDNGDNSKDIAALSDFADFHEGYVRHYVALADSKAAILFGLTTTFIAFLFSKPAFHALLFAAPCNWPSGLAWTAAALLVAGTWLAASVVAPRLKNSGEGLVFFGAVRAYPNGEDYARAVRSAGADHLAELRLRHCYDVSTVCWRKYAHLRLATWSCAAGLLASLPLLGSL